MDKKLYFYTRGMDVGYDGQPLIRDICMELSRGRILTLIGPNGAGKSTILKSITRQISLLGGTVVLDGEDMLKMKGRLLARKQAVVLTDPLRPEMMTCAEVVGTGRYPYTGSLGLLGPEDYTMVSRALELVHAQDIADRDFMTVSDGQRQRILLARALTQEPEIIILDEPTSYLDVRYKMDFLSILRRMVREKNLAVVMSLHELDLAQRISDEVMCVKGPYIDRWGTPEEIFTDDYIRQLYEIHDGNYHADFGSMELPVPDGEPEHFVICGGGSGIPVFRYLQREGFPFIAGILQENDLDYAAASYMATEVISSPAWEPVSPERYAYALDRMKSCNKVWCPLETFGSLNQVNRRLRDYAAEAGSLQTYSGIRG